MPPLHYVGTLFDHHASNLQCRTLKLFYTFKLSSEREKKSKRSLNLDFSFNLEKLTYFCSRKKNCRMLLYFWLVLQWAIPLHLIPETTLDCRHCYSCYAGMNQNNNTLSPLKIQYKINSKFRWSTFIVVNYCISMRMQRQTTKPSHTRTHTQVEVWKSQWIKIFAHVKPSQIGRID